MPGSFIPSSSYPFTYIICDKFNPTVCVTNNGWISVLSNARTISNDNTKTENLKPNEMTVLPNPSNGLFNLIFSDIVPGDLSIEIFNILGQKIFAHKVKNIDAYLFDINDLPNATYLLKTYNDGVEINKLIIKQ